MGIGGINQSTSLDIDKLYKVPEKNINSNPIENNNELNEKEKNDNQVKAAVIKLNKFLEGESTHLKYEKHDVFNTLIVKIVDNNTNEVLREIPSRKILDMVAKMCEMAGILVDKKA